MKMKKLIAELRDITKREAELRFNPSEELADSVKDYRSGFGKTIVIRGYGDAKWQRLRILYAEKSAELTHRIGEMERFLDNIDDPEIRTILRMRYADGMTQEEVGEALGYSRQAIQKKEERFWQE